MILQHIVINNFKNIRFADVLFSHKINGLIGNNGMGKSNMLDAIYYLSFCRSFNGLMDRQLILDGESFVMLHGEYLRGGVEENVQFGLTSGKKKSLKRKGKEYQRLSQHIGLFPLVLVAPHDISLINGTSEDRRLFIDRIISQSDSVYLEHLIRYTKLLDQRNKLLRTEEQNRSLFEVIEFQMQIAADYIAMARRQFVSELSELFSHYYAAITAGDEHVALGYHTTVGEGQKSLQEQFDESRRKDEYLGHTTSGIHRDDLEMQLNGMGVRKIASQGQCKTFVVSMRLAQYDFLKQTTGLHPMLLLDDVFDKLDATRVERIIDLVAGDRFGQIFITDTNRSHLDQIMRHISSDYRLWSVSGGNFNILTE